MKQFRTVFEFEIMSYLRSKAYRITTVSLVCLALLLGAVPAIIAGVGSLGGGNAEQKGDAGAPIGVYDAGGTLDAKTLDSFLGASLWAWLDSADDSEVEEAVASGEYSLVLAVDGLAYTVTSPGSDTFGLSTAAYADLVKQSYQSAMLRESGLSEQEIGTILTATPVATLVSVGKDAGQSYWLGYTLLMLLYMAILMYGQFVMTSVVTEKTSKAVELLIISVKPVYLIFGKVIGAGLAGLTQLCAIILSGAVSLTLSKSAWAELAPSFAAMLDFSATGALLLFALVFFLLGFFAFAFLYAAFASTVSRMEDMNTVALFPMLPFMAAFFVAIFGMMNPSATYVTVCSFIPFLSPMVMYMRICVTDVPALQIALSVLINLATIGIAGVFGAKLYRAGVLMYGVKPSLRIILKSIGRA
jgi:ABC-2 type transport system permease protein